MRLVGLVCLVCACGRVDFAEQTDASAVDTTASPDANPLLATAFAYWKFDEGSGSVANDSSGHGHTLDAASGITWSPGKIGTAITTDGVSQFLVSSANLDLSATNAVTVSFWFDHSYGGAAMFHDVVELTDNMNNYQIGFGVFVDDNQDCGSAQIGLGLTGDVGGSANCFPAPSSGTWHHVVAVFDKTQPGCCETALYVDGAPQSGTNTFNMQNTNNFGSAQLYLMARGGAGAFSSGSVDELAVFARALTPQEIATL